MDKKEVAAIFGEKWLIRFRDKDGSRNGGIVGSYKNLAAMIEHIRNLDGYDIEIRDETPGFYEDKGDIFFEERSGGVF